VVIERAAPRLLAGLVAAAIASACGPRANSKPQAAAHSVAWRSLGSWSGRGSLQTESFTSETGALRVRWETTLPKADPPLAPSVFRLNAHSAISGRLLQQVVEQSGAGSGVGYVQQDPHVFYVVVESNQLSWTFTVEEAIGYP
jgi:outer membrane biogenesis lipoprotein LolB